MRQREGGEGGGTRGGVFTNSEDQDGKVEKERERGKTDKEKRIDGKKKKLVKE